MNRVITWEEPNRAKTPPLHIGARGARYSSLTGVWWIDESRFVVNHRSGLRVALFDLNQGDQPLAVARIPHLTDDVAVTRVGENRWEVSVSGCWACAYSRFELVIGPRPRFHFLGSGVRFRHLRTKPHSSRSFCHGVAYDPQGRLWLAYNTGERPRVEIDGGPAWTLPQPWGPRDACTDAEGTTYVVATSANPKTQAYDSSAMSVWKLESGQQEWTLFSRVDAAHVDACQVHRGMLYANDQLGDRVLVIDLGDGRQVDTLKDDSFSFPHGIGISPTGMLAVTNYGTSAISLIRL